MCREALAAFARHGSTPGVLYVQGDTRGYEDVVLPDGWKRIDTGMRFLDHRRHCFREYPDEPWYGFLADDNRPATDGFDAAMIGAAGAWRLACAKSPMRELAIWPHGIPSAMVLGGNLVRDVGWWAPPHVGHCTTDVHWLTITRAAGAAVLVDAVVEHVHWQEGNRPKDETDLTYRKHVDSDVTAMNDWMSANLDAVVARVKTHVATA